MLDLVTLSKDNKPTTTSKIIADRFHKVHRDVVRAINNLDIPEDFRVRNFAQSKFKTDNINGLEYDCYEITRDGFTLLAMGFTGKRAMKFKIDFINAFNAMEAKLTELNSHYSITTDKEAMKAIGGMVKRCCATAIKETLLTENPNLVSAVGCLIDYIAEERGRKMFKVWKETTKKHLIDELG